MHLTPLGLPAGAEPTGGGWGVLLGAIGSICPHICTPKDLRKFRTGGLQQSSIRRHQILHIRRSHENLWCDRMEGGGAICCRWCRVRIEICSIHHTGSKRSRFSLTCKNWFFPFCDSCSAAVTCGKEPVWLNLNGKDASAHPYCSPSKNLGTKMHVWKELKSLLHDFWIISAQPRDPFQDSLGRAFAVHLPDQILRNSLIDVPGQVWSSPPP